MIALWMLSACAFALTVGAAAFAVDRLLRLFQKQSRGIWLVALLVASLWPIASPILRAARSEPATTSATSVQAASTNPAPIAIDARRQWRERLAQFDSLLLMVWAIATTCLLVRAARTAGVLHRMRSNAIVRTAVGRAVLGSPNIGPAVFGIVRPRIILPAWAFDLAETDCDLVLRHEEAHIRAADPALLLVATLLRALMPWNVGVWWIVQRLRLAIEVDCDARVLRTGADATRYARLLLLTAQQQRQTTITAFIAGFPSMLEERINVMHTEAPTNRMRFTITFGAICLACTSFAASPVLARELSAVRVPKLALQYAPQSAPPQRPLREFQVDSQATLLAGSPLPAYPDDLRQQKVSGSVTAQMVVDTMGRVQPPTLKVLSSTDARLVDAIRVALADLEFNPARVSARRVKQLVQINFLFKIAGTKGASVTPSSAIRTIDVVISPK